MVFAYSSAIITVQNNYTQLNQVNYGLCVADLILCMFIFSMSFLYALPYNSIIINIVVILELCYDIAYSSVSIYYYTNNVLIDNVFYNMCVAKIIIGSMILFFEIFIRKCIGVGCIYNDYFNDDFNSEEYYSVLDILKIMCGVVKKNINVPVAQIVKDEIMGLV